MLNRPFFNTPIEALERQFDQSRADRAFLETLLAELKNRSNRRAGELRLRAVQALSVLARETEPTPASSGSSAPDLFKTTVAATPRSSATSGGQRLEGPASADFEPGTDGDAASLSPSGDAVDDVGPRVDAGAEHDETITPEDDAAWNSAGDPAADTWAGDEASWVAGGDDPAVRATPPRARHFTNRPTAIIDAWTALEVLSPQTFGRPEDLANGDRHVVARFDDRPLPWQLPDKALKKTRLYYHVVLGSVRMDRAEQSLLKVFRDARVERPATKKLAALAVITVDKAGRPTDESSIAVSSFGWAFGRVCAGALAHLGRWGTVEREVMAGLTKRLVVETEDEGVEPLTRERIDAAYLWLTQTFGIPGDHLEAPFFAIRAYQWIGLKEAPEPLLLNSFYLRDLGRARALVEAGKAGPALRRFLGVDAPAGRTDLFRDRRALERLLNPKTIPAARWPSGKHSLVLLQQVAVNIARSELADSGIAAVNGPPGTGKTTLLRDVLASVVLDRARALAGFDDPEAAFQHRAKIRQGAGFAHLYELHPAVRGHELLVASSNNKAVENVSRELPGLRNIAQEAGSPRYFRTVADALAGAEGASWGARGRRPRQSS